MELVSKRNFIIFIAALLVVAFGMMSLYLNNKRRNEVMTPAAQQYDGVPMNSSDDIDDIEEDLDNTDIDSMDKELQNMEKELQNL